MKLRTWLSIVVVLGLALAVFSPITTRVNADSPGSVVAGESQDFMSLLSSMPGVQFVHTATADNITENFTEIDHPLTNDNPNAIIFVTPNWNPGGSSGLYNDHAIGVWYDDNSGRRAVFNQDLANMPDGADFNVIVFSSKIYLPILVR